MAEEEAGKRKGKGSKKSPPVCKFDVCITTYEMLTANPEAFKPVTWEYMIIDEAHRLKNREAKALGALRELTCIGTKLALTGTPLQNHVSELWSMLNFLEPGISQAQANAAHNSRDLHHSHLLLHLHPLSSSSHTHRSV